MHSPLMKTGSCFATKDVVKILHFLFYVFILTLSRTILCNLLRASACLCRFSEFGSVLYFFYFAMCDSEDNPELNGSELGTKEYWDSAYNVELNNYNSHGDVGEVWFGEESALRVIRWMCSSEQVKKNDSIIDLGCGNGMMLVKLAGEGFTDLSGIDYSETAIDLAKAIAQKQNLKINYKVYDLLADSKSNVDSEGDKKFQIALDKGTYDAISLHPEEPREKRMKYLKALQHLLLQGGLFILTSCNWTQEELKSHFQEGFRHLLTIPTPKFKFGGKTGNSVTTLVFEKA